MTAGDRANAAGQRPSTEAALAMDDRGDGERGATPATPAVSIVVCTHNGVQGLETLVPVLMQQMAGQPLELIVVDSASRPDQAAAIAAMMGRCARTRLVRLDEAGLSRARNAAAALARADWLVLLDDDEVPARHWAKNLLALVDRLPADCAACGGNVVPIYPAGTAPRISPRWFRYLSMTQQSGEFDQTAAPALVGGHVLLRRRALDQVGGFELRLGRSGTSLLSGEEVLLLRRLTGRGWTIWHSASIEVGHHVTRDRLNRGWAKERAHWEGVSTVRLLSLDDQPGLRKLALRATLKQPPLWLLTRVLGRFNDLDLRLSFLAGVRSELERLRAEPVETPRHEGVC